MNSPRLGTLFCPGIPCALAALGLLFAAGCRVSSASSRSVQVWGKVTYHGEPVRGDMIIFTPLENSDSDWAMGVLDDQGRYTLATSLPQVPVKAGPYRVYLRPMIKARRGSVVPDSRRGTAEQSEPTKVTTPDESTIPQRFLAPQTSGIQVIVEQDSNRIDIDLKD